MLVFITGCCDFVGSELVVSLLESSGLPGLEIIGIDNLLSGGSWRNPEWLRSVGMEVRQDDFRNVLNLEAFAPIDLGRC
jgi:nucleoside-diphosphate-sugar epimerase